MHSEQIELAKALLNSANDICDDMKSFTLLNVAKAIEDIEKAISIFTSENDFKSSHSGFETKIKLHAIFSKKCEDMCDHFEVSPDFSADQITTAIQTIQKASLIFDRIKDSITFKNCMEIKARLHELFGSKYYEADDQKNNNELMNDLHEAAEHFRIAVITRNQHKLKPDEELAALPLNIWTTLINSRSLKRKTKLKYISLAINYYNLTLNEETKELPKIKIAMQNILHYEKLLQESQKPAQPQKRKLEEDSIESQQNNTTLVTPVTLFYPDHHSAKKRKLAPDYYLIFMQGKYKRELHKRKRP